MSKFRLIFVVLFALFFASSAYAADIRLSSRCTLADAIIAANNDRAEGNCPAGRGADTIILSQDITLRAELPAITSTITIEGNGYTISGNNRYRIFYNDGGDLTINNLTMTKGRAENEGDIITNADGSLKATETNPVGGAIVNWAGTITISDSSFSGNSAELGGAIFNDGELSISDSAFSRNSADRGGAIVNGGNGELSISDSVFQNNLAERGGAVHNWEELSIVNSAFQNNSAELGGAIANVDKLSIVNSAFSGNSAEQGGAVHNWDELSISDSSFSGNSADEAGGAIANGEDGELSIGNSAFQNNSAEYGGAIYNWEELSISSSTFSDNSAEQGGAIFNWEDGELSISDSTFSDNSAEYGGAIDNRGELSMVNSAFSSNSANWGGAIYNWGELSIVSSTFSGNSADQYVGAIYNDGGTLSMINSIIAGRGRDACYSGNRLKQNIRNFIQDGSCSPAFRGDPRLGALVTPADGSPAYFPLLANSRAIDAADDDYCPETDQIGTERPQGAGCDIGAIEYVSPTSAPTSRPEGFKKQDNPNELALEALIELLPNSLPDGKVQWNRDISRGDDGLDRIRGIRGTAAGKRVYFRTQEGGLMHLDFAVFDTAEEARANYDRILGIRSTLETGKPKDNFPQPNIFGTGLYGSVAIFQIDNYFIEVFIEIFTRNNPLETLSRETIRFFERNRSTFEYVSP